MIKYWIAVASLEHVKKGVKEGFCQACHGKAFPLNQMQEGDFIIYYSPVEIFGSKTPCQKFTALGQIKKGESYQVQMSPDFIPWRKDVEFLSCREIPISVLLSDLSFITDKKRWGFPFRRGLFFYLSKRF